MQKLIFTLIIIPLISLSIQAQTTGFLTFSFNQPQPTSPSGTKNVLAVWIESNSGTFTKTIVRYWGNGTKDHLPVWKSKSGQNTVDAISGATLKSSTNPTAFGVKTMIWDGKDVNGNIVADGTYKVWVESAWQNNLAANTHNSIISFSFTKGTNTEHLTPTGNTYFNNISLDWVPSAVGIPKPITEADFSIFPNPAKEKITISGKGIKTIVIYDVTGKMLLNTNEKTIDLNTFTKGMYLIKIFTESGSFVKKFYKVR